MKASMLDELSRVFRLEARDRMNEKRDEHGRGQRIALIQEADRLEQIADQLQSQAGRAPGPRSRAPGAAYDGWIDFILKASKRR